MRKSESSLKEPCVTITLSLHPTTYHFSNPIPPTIALTLTSTASGPITLFTWATPLHPKRALVNRGFIITSLPSGAPVPTTYIQVQRAPFQRVRGSLDEQYFLTLHPGVPTTVSTGFGRAGGSLPPQPKSIVERGWELDENGKELRIRRSTHATGVDGLEPGRRYKIGLNMETLRACRWARGTKDDVLVDQGGERSYLQDADWESAPLEWDVGSEVELSVK